jgi:hypothetical protein
MPRRSARHAKLVKVASYYVLFAALESMVMAGFSIAAVVGFKSSAWVVVGGLAGHGVLMPFKGNVLQNSGVPVWWRPFVSRMTSERQVALPAL